MEANPREDCRALTTRGCVVRSAASPLPRVPCGRSAGGTPFPSVPRVGVTSPREPHADLWAGTHDPEFLAGADTVS